MGLPMQFLLKETNLTFWVVVTQHHFKPRNTPECRLGSLASLVFIPCINENTYTRAHSNPRILVWSALNNGFSLPQVDPRIP